MDIDEFQRHLQEWGREVNPNDCSVCKVCGKEHGSTVCKEASKLSEKIWRENGERERRLKAKCSWEHMTRTAVLKHYGDPAGWGETIDERRKRTIEQAEGLGNAEGMMLVPATPDVLDELKGCYDGPVRYRGGEVESIAERIREAWNPNGYYDPPLEEILSEFVRVREVFVKYVLAVAASEGIEFATDRNLAPCAMLEDDFTPEEDKYLAGVFREAKKRWR